MGVPRHALAVVCLFVGLAFVVFSLEVERVDLLADPVGYALGAIGAGVLATEAPARGTGTARASAATGLFAAAVLASGRAASEPGAGAWLLVGPEGATPALVAETLASLALVLSLWVLAAWAPEDEDAIRSRCSAAAGANLALIPLPFVLDTVWSTAPPPPLFLALVLLAVLGVVALTLGALWTAWELPPAGSGPVPS